MGHAFFTHAWDVANAVIRRHVPIVICPGRIKRETSITAAVHSSAQALSTHRGFAGRDYIPIFQRSSTHPQRGLLFLSVRSQPQQTLPDDEKQGGGWTDCSRHACHSSIGVVRTRDPSVIVRRGTEPAASRSRPTATGRDPRNTALKKTAAKSRQTSNGRTSGKMRRNRAKAVIEKDPKGRRKEDGRRRRTARQCRHTKHAHIPSCHIKYAHIQHKHRAAARTA